MKKSSNMRQSILTAGVLLTSYAFGQSTTSSASVISTRTAVDSSLLYPSGPYETDSSYSYNSLTTSNGTASSTSSGSATSSASTSTSSSSTGSRIILSGGGGSTSTRSGNSTASSTSSSAAATNTQPCNGYPEFCSRKFSNVSMVVAHNSPFHIKNNAASNQVNDVTTQLNDGIRGLQFETHKPNSTMMLCHTSCDLLNAGTLEAYLTTVVVWLEQHRFEVITIMMGNDDRVDPSNYLAPFQNSGMLNYVYEVPTKPMTLDDWPTMANMILTNKRVVVMLDYLADQTKYPWLLDMFSNQWQTPFSPTDPAFPCTEQRPPNLAQATAENWMYMDNHNLNIEISISSVSLLIPAYTLLNQTNALSGNASVGANVNNCTAMWNRPPNWILVDYYNFGSPFNGSVFQVAADANNVTYNRASCCGTTSTSAGERLRKPGISAWFSIVVAAVFAVSFV